MPYVTRMDWKISLLVRFQGVADIGDCTILITTEYAVKPLSWMPTGAAAAAAAGLLYRLLSRQSLVPCVCLRRHCFSTS